jgi:amidohydrolase
MESNIASLTHSIVEQITEIRHTIHSHPELGYHEENTASIIESFLDKAGIQHHRCAGTGVVATITGCTGPVVALRAEMDALPTPDLSGLPYASQIENTAHACGHDGHIAILLGTAWVLKQIVNELSGTVKLVWQPAEEGGAGAARMIEDGVLENPAPEVIFALHGWPGLDVGNAGVRFGTAMASVDNFEITITGKSTHAAMPQGGIDPIPVAAQIVEALQTVRSRMIDPLKPCVISITTIHGGSAYNIIPDTVTMTGTIRTLDPDIRRSIPPHIEQLVHLIANASGADARFLITEGYPPTINDDRATTFARDAIATVLGSDNVIEITDAVMGGEDFSYYLEKIPGSFIRLGMGNRPSLHNSKYDFQDDAIFTGINIMSSLAVQFCKKRFSI